MPLFQQRIICCNCGKVLDSKFSLTGGDSHTYCAQCSKSVKSLIGSLREQVKDLMDGGLTLSEALRRLK